MCVREHSIMKKMAENYSTCNQSLDTILDSTATLKYSSFIFTKCLNINNIVLLYIYPWNQTPYWGVTGDQVNHQFILWESSLYELWIIIVTQKTFPYPLNFSTLNLLDIPDIILYDQYTIKAKQKIIFGLYHFSLQLFAPILICHYP